MTSHLNHFLSHGGVKSTCCVGVEHQWWVTHTHTHSYTRQMWFVVCRLVMNVGGSLLDLALYVCVCVYRLQNSGGLWWNPTASLSVWLRIRRLFYEVGVFFCVCVYVLVCSGGSMFIGSFSLWICVGGDFVRQYHSYIRNSWSWFSTRNRGKEFHKIVCISSPRSRSLVLWTSSLQVQREDDNRHSFLLHQPAAVMMTVHPCFTFPALSALVMAHSFPRLVLDLECYLVSVYQISAYFVTQVVVEWMWASVRITFRKRTGICIGFEYRHVCVCGCIDWVQA